MRTTITMLLPSVSFGEVMEQNVHSSFLLDAILHGRAHGTVGGQNSGWMEAALLQQETISSSSWTVLASVFGWHSIVCWIMGSKAWMARLLFEWSWRLWCWWLQQWRLVVSGIIGLQHWRLVIGSPISPLHWRMVVVLSGLMWCLILIIEQSSNSWRPIILMWLSPDICSLRSMMLVEHHSRPHLLLSSECPGCGDSLMFSNLFRTALATSQSIRVRALH